MNINIVYELGDVYIERVYCSEENEVMYQAYHKNHFLFESYDLEEAKTFCLAYDPTVLENKWREQKKEFEEWISKELNRE